MSLFSEKKNIFFGFFRKSWTMFETLKITLGKKHIYSVQTLNNFATNNVFLRSRNFQNCCQKPYFPH